MKIISYPINPCAIRHELPREMSGAVSSQGAASARAEVLVHRISYGELFPPAAGPAHTDHVDDAIKDLMVESLDLGGMKGSYVLGSLPPGYLNVSNPDNVGVTDIVGSIFKLGNLAIDGLPPSSAVDGISLVLNAAQFVRSGIKNDLSPVELKIDAAKLVLKVVTVAAARFGYPSAASLATGASLLFTAGKVGYLLQMPKNPRRKSLP